MKKFSIPFIFLFFFIGCSSQLVTLDIRDIKHPISLSSVVSLNNKTEALENSKLKLKVSSYEKNTMILGSSSTKWVRNEGSQLNRKNILYSTKGDKLKCMNNVIILLEHKYIFIPPTLFWFILDELKIDAEGEIISVKKGN